MLDALRRHPKRLVQPGDQGFRRLHVPLRRSVGEHPDGRVDLLGLLRQRRSDDGARPEPRQQRARDPGGSARFRGCPSGFLAVCRAHGLGDRGRLANRLQAPLAPLCHERFQLCCVHLL